MKQTLLFIGHDFHRHTKSNRFILDLIEKKFDVEICSFVPDYGENGSWLSSLKRKHYDVVLCWQLMPSIRVLRQFCSFDFGVFFPMADYYYRAQKDVTAPIWREYQDFQIISFSRKMHEDLIANGFSSHYFQYFPKPEETVPDGDPDSVFFWQRVSHINIYTLLTLLKNYGIRHLHIHKAVDPGETYIPLPYEYQGQMNVSYSSWFENKEEMLKCMDQSALYVASRYCEGIGMSFLEAMAHGRCVIAPNETTFNEYIEHGKTGFLFEPSAPKPLPKQEIRTIQKNTRDFISKGYREWEKKREEIVPLFTQKAEKNSRKIQKLAAVWRQREPEVSANSAPQEPGSSLCVKVKKYMDILRNRSEIYHNIGEKRFCGIRYFLKMERNDGKRILIFFFGIPLLSVEFLEEN